MLPSMVPFQTMNIKSGMLQEESSLQTFVLSTWQHVRSTSKALAWRVLLSLAHISYLSPPTIAVLIFARLPCTQKQRSLLSQLPKTCSSVTRTI